jgi:hypothetical protein
MKLARGGQPTKDGGWAARPCGHCPTSFSQRCGGGAKEVESGGEQKKGGRRWPASHQYLSDRPCLVSTQPLLLSSTSSCSYNGHSTDQNHQKQSKFLSSFSKALFIYYYYFEILYFILRNDEINMLWKRSK